MTVTSWSDPKLFFPFTNTLFFPGSRLRLTSSSFVTGSKVKLEMVLLLNFRVISDLLFTLSSMALTFMFWCWLTKGSATGSVIFTSGGCWLDRSWWTITTLSSSDPTSFSTCTYTGLSPLCKRALKWISPLLGIKSNGTDWLFTVTFLMCCILVILVRAFTL